MAEWYTGIQIDFAHLCANSQVNLYLRELPNKHWDTTESKIRNCSPLPVPHDGKCNGKVAAARSSLDLQVPIAGVILGDVGERVSINGRAH